MTDQSVTLVLEKHLDMKSVQDTAKRAAAAMDGVSRFVLDAAAVERIDGAGIQLLLSTVRTARGKGLEVSWRQPSTALREAAALLGLDGELALGE